MHPMYPSFQGREKVPAYWLGAFFNPRRFLSIIKQVRKRSKLQCRRRLFSFCVLFYCLCIGSRKELWREIFFNRTVRFPNRNHRKRQRPRKRIVSYFVPLLSLCISAALTGINARLTFYLNFFLVKRTTAGRNVRVRYLPVGLRMGENYRGPLGCTS